MKNPVFAAAVEHFSKVEAEIAKADAQQTRVDQLKKNEADLLLKVNDLASQVAQANHDKANAEMEARAIVERARSDAANLYSSAKAQEAHVKEEAVKVADKIVQDAHAQAVDIRSKGKDARDELADLNRKLLMSQEKLDELKRAARAFLGDK